MRTASRALLGIGVVLAAGLAVVAGQAQSARYPEKPVKILVGFAAGGGTDVAARIIAQKLSETLGQSVVVENRPGASGMIATEAVAKSPADGYTLLMGSQTTLAVAPVLYRKFGIDAARDFAGVAMAGVSPPRPPAGIAVRMSWRCVWKRRLRSPGLAPPSLSSARLL